MRFSVLWMNKLQIWEQCFFFIPNKKYIFLYQILYIKFFIKLGEKNTGKKEVQKTVPAYLTLAIKVSELHNSPNCNINPFCL